MNKFMTILCILSCSNTSDNVHKKQFESDIQPMMKDKLTQESIDKIKSIWVELSKKANSKLNEYDFTNKEKEDLLRDNYKIMNTRIRQDLNIEYTKDELNPRVLDEIFLDSYLEVEKIINNDPKYKAK